MNSPRHLVLDIETVSDGALVSRVRYPGEGLDPKAAIARYRAELMEKNGTDFVPYTFQVPVSVAIGTVGEDFRLSDLVVLDEPAFRPHVIAEQFWRGWEKRQPCTLVTFNGRGFDLPVMEMAAFRYGLPLPRWFDTAKAAYQQPRNRFNLHAHLDLQELLTNFGAARFSGGLNLAAQVLGKPGKMDVQGHMVQDLFDQGRVKEINDYCRCDVLDTYFVFLRTRVMLGELTLEAEQALVEATKAWLTSRAGDQPAYRAYLDRWGDWVNPWGTATP